MAALVVAGCGAEASVESPLPPGFVTLATFTAVVDTDAGTILIETQSPDAGGVPIPGALVLASPSEVTVANNGSPWNNSTAHGCGGIATWGASVTVTNKLTGTSLVGLYAEITDFVGGTGNEACNGVAPAATPTGLNGQYGLWSYPTLAAGAGASTDWTFRYVSAAKFTFHGRIVGAKVDAYTIAMAPAAMPSNTTRTVGAIGTGGVVGKIVVGAVPVTGNPALVFLDPVTGAESGSRASMSSASVVASVGSDLVNNRVWYTSGTNVGYVNGTNQAVRIESPNKSRPAASIVVDPTNTLRAWVVEPTNARLRSFFANNPGTTVTRNSGSAAGSNPVALVFGVSNSLFVTSASGIQEFSVPATITGTATLRQTYPVPTSPTSGYRCAGPASLAYDPNTATLWIGALTNGVVCSVTFTGSIGARTARWTEVASQVNPTALAIGLTGLASVSGSRAWAGGSVNNTLRRVDATGPGYSLVMPSGSGAVGAICATPDALWVTNAASVFRVRP
jgi:hypothetical protein